MKAFSQAAKNEIQELSRSGALRNDLEIVSRGRHNPFVKGGIVDCDAYIEFLVGYNEFINHEPKRFVPMVERDMRL